MEYKLAVVVLLIIYFIFMYQVGLNADEYCMADNSRDSKISFCAMVGSLGLAFLFLAWAVYEYNLEENTKLDIILLISDEKKKKAKQDYIDSPDPNIKSAMDRKLDFRRVESTNITETPETQETSPPPMYPTSEFDKFQIVNKSPERGNVHEYY